MSIKQRNTKKPKKLTPHAAFIEQQKLLEMLQSGSVTLHELVMREAEASASLALEEEILLSDG